MKEKKKEKKKRKKREKKKEKKKKKKKRDRTISRQKNQCCAAHVWDIVPEHVPEQTKHKTTHLRSFKTILLEHVSSLDHGCGWRPAGNGGRPSCARSLLDPSFRSSGKHTRQFISGDSERSGEKGEEEDGGGGGGEENEKREESREKVSDWAGGGGGGGGGGEW